MHSRILALVAAVVLLPLVSAAETVKVVAKSEEPQNALVFNVGALINGIVAVEYERALAPLIGVELGMSVLAFRGVFAPPTTVNVIAVGPEVGLRFHLFRPAVGGLWFGPSVNAMYLAAPAGLKTVRAFGYGLGLAVGYNFLLGGFLVQLGLGGGVDDYGEGLVWSPRLRLGMGFAF